MTSQFYEKLYKVQGMPGKIFTFVSEDKEDKIFNDFEVGDARYWIEDSPKLVKGVN